MSAKHSKEEFTLTLEEAVDTLSNIVEMDIDSESILTTLEEPADQPLDLKHKVVYWLQGKNIDETANVIKETFRVILHHLRNYDKKGYWYLPNDETTESIKSIMVLVGEAAKKLDRHAILIHHEKELSPTHYKEYKRLQEFYQTRIARRVDENLLGKWIMGLSQRVFAQTIPHQVAVAEALPSLQTKHVFVDLETVKNDSEYELFFIKKDDGERFFNSRLIKNIKLICDFGKHITEPRADDPLVSLSIWRDRFLQGAARGILGYALPSIEAFSHYVEALHEDELYIFLEKAIVALMLSSNPHNIEHDMSLKSTRCYFADFQHFLRQALNTREYQHLVAYPEEKSEPGKVELDLIQALCKGLFTQPKSMQELAPQLNILFEEGREAYGKNHPSSDTKALSQLLGEEYTLLTKFFKPHATGPLLNMIDLLENESYQAFDPILQSNLPNSLFSLSFDDYKALNIRMPSPTRQAQIGKSYVIEEFEEFLRALPDGEHFLVINLQDRTAWREHSRCVALEDLQHHPDFSDKLTVVTIPKETEFYFQMVPYNHENHAETFIESFKAKLLDDMSGFYFPDKVKKVLTEGSLEQMLRAVHQVFFGGRNVLPRERRQDFIEIFYLMLEMKIIDSVRPTLFSLVCKDGIDLSEAANGELFVFINLLRKEKFSKSDFELLNQMLYMPAIIHRERVMLPERFNRLTAVLKEIELVRDSLGWKNFAEKVDTYLSPFFGKNVISSIRIEPA